MSLLSTLFAAAGDELNRLETRARKLLAESVASSAVELLPEYERDLGLGSDGALAERQARVVSRLVARQRYRPSDFQFALAPLLGQAAEDVVVLERTNAIAASMGDVREIFRFFIFRDPTLPGAYQLDAAQELVDEIKPKHAAGHVIESNDFLIDDEFSLFERDLFG